MIELPRSTVYYRSTATRAELPDQRLVELIGEIQDKFAGYGYRRATIELRRRGFVVNHKRIARVMASAGLGIKSRRPFVLKTDSDHDMPVFPNPLPQRHSDLARMSSGSPTSPTSASKAASAAWLRSWMRAAGYAISKRIDTPLALAALRAAVYARRPERGSFIHHSDRGSQPRFN